MYSRGEGLTSVVEGLVVVNAFKNLEGWRVAIIRFCQSASPRRWTLTDSGQPIKYDARLTLPSLQLHISSAITPARIAQLILHQMKEFRKGHFTSRFTPHSHCKGSWHAGLRSGNTKGLLVPLPLYRFLQYFRLPPPRKS